MGGDGSGRHKDPVNIYTPPRTAIAGIGNTSDMQYELPNVSAVKEGDNLIQRQNVSGAGWVFNDADGKMYMGGTPPAGGTESDPIFMSHSGALSYITLAQSGALSYVTLAQSGALSYVTLAQSGSLAAYPLKAYVETLSGSVVTLSGAAMRSGAANVTADHTSSGAVEIINAIYSTSASPPVAASGTTEGTIYIQYTA